MDLKRLFELQATLNKRVGLDDASFEALFSNGEIVAGGSPNYNKRVCDAGRWIDDMLKAMSSEIEELRDCTYWKHWCSEAQSGKRYMIKDLDAGRKEIIDILHFWVSLAQVLGMSAEMVGAMYEEKLAKNIKRQDDGYSIEEKDLAWDLFRQKNPGKHPQNPWPNAQSLEELPEEIQAYYLALAKAKTGTRQSLCNTCVHGETECSMAVGVTHSCAKYHKRIDNPLKTFCYKCHRKCDAGYAMTGEGPVCGSCV